MSVYRIVNDEQAFNSIYNSNDSRNACNTANDNTSYLTTSEGFIWFGPIGICDLKTLCKEKLPVNVSHLQSIFCKEGYSSQDSWICPGFFWSENRRTLKQNSSSSLAYESKFRTLSQKLFKSMDSKSLSVNRVFGNR